MNEETELLNKIYQGASMGSQSLKAILPKVKDPQLEATIRTQQAGYHQYAHLAKEALTQNQEKPKEKLSTKITVPVGITLNTMFSTSSSHLAEMMINGSTMGIVDISKELRRHPKQTPAAELGRSLLQKEQSDIDTLKGYLK